MPLECDKQEPVLDPTTDLLPRPMKDIIKGQTNTYEVLDALGKGGFGAVFKVRRIEDDKYLAMKCEAACNKKPILKFEAEVLLATQKVASTHLLHYEDHGAVRDRFKFVVIRLAGKNLWELRMKQKEKRFSMATSLRLAEQSLAGIRDIHRTGYIHRDIKPPNFAIGREDDQTQHTVFILDFGLCRRYRTLEKDIRHPRTKAAFRGTTRYASLNCLELKEQARKDDIESWWYMVVEWTVGHLPWKSCKGTDRMIVLEYKQQLRKDENMKKMLALCPIYYMTAILRYLDSLEYNDIPDYDYIYRQVAAAQKAYNCNLQEAPEWDVGATSWKGPSYKEGMEYNMKLL